MEVMLSNDEVNPLPAPDTPAVKAYQALHNYGVQQQTWNINKMVLHA
jgi:hypothetical protein